MSLIIAQQSELDKYFDYRRNGYVFNEPVEFQMPALMLHSDIYASEIVAQTIHARNIQCEKMTCISCFATNATIDTATIENLAISDSGTFNILACESISATQLLVRKNLKTVYGSMLVVCCPDIAANHLTCRYLMTNADNQAWIAQHKTLNIDNVDDWNIGKMLAVLQDKLY